MGEVTIHDARDPDLLASQDPAASPLGDDGAQAWERLVLGLDPARMLARIGQRMGPLLRERLSPEDLWQETLLHVWRDRGGVQWRGWPALRAWVMQVAENRIRHAAEQARTARRGGGATPASLDATRDAPPPPVASTTPSRVASFAEQGEAMRQAVEDLPEEVREVVRLRLLEEVPVLDVAARLGIGESAVKHRFRRGAMLYQARLRELFGAGKSDHRERR